MVTRTRTQRRPRHRRTKRKAVVSRAVKKYVRRSMPRVEMKQIWYHDNEVQLNTLTQGAMQGYPQIANGQSNSTRIGSDISLKGVHVKGTLYNNSGSESYARLLIVGHPGTIDPNYATFPLFKNTSAGATTTISGLNGLDTMYYPLNNTEIKVHYDKKFRLAGSATAGGPSNTRMFSHFVKFPGKGKLIRYKGNTSGVNNQNWFVSIYWIVADANDDTTSGTVVELSQLTRIYFTDV